MPNSQWQVSVDIIDPASSPFLEINTNRVAKLAIDKIRYATGIMGADYVAGLNGKRGENTRS
jgi:hypothetical protein